MCLLSACLIAVTLLLVDQARLSASYNTGAAARRNANANASNPNAGTAAPAGMSFGGANHQQQQQQQYGTASSVGTYANSYAGSAV